MKKKQTKDTLKEKKIAKFKSNPELQMQKWKELVSKKILSKYALPMTRNFEAKLLSLKTMLDR